MYKRCGLYIQTAGAKSSVSYLAGEVDQRGTGDDDRFDNRLGLAHPAISAFWPAWWFGSSTSRSMTSGSPVTPYPNGVEAEGLASGVSMRQFLWGKWLAQTQENGLSGGSNVGGGGNYCGSGGP